MTTAFFTDKRFAAHTYAGHPEHAGRLEAVIQRLQTGGVWDALHHISAEPANDEQLLAVHTRRYLDELAATAKIPGGTHLGVDTYIVPESYELARLAAGGVISVVDAVMKGEADNGIAAVRPPGHHATPTTGMGFCLLSNIAIAARHALNAHHLERVAIVDFDVHHGNGTQGALYNSKNVLFVSSHQSPLYPGTGGMDETGSGEGKGFTVNIPLPPGTGDPGIMRVYEEIVIPILQRYDPQLVLVSAGFDAHWVDPLAQLELSSHGFDYITRILIKFARSACEGRIIFVMEGGYDLNALSFGWLNIASALLDRDSIPDPYGAAKNARMLPDSLLKNLKSVHSLA